MSVCLMVIHDGRGDYLERTAASAREMLVLPRFDQYVTVDDTSHALGFAGAIQAGWNQVDADWVFHLEGDFTFNEPILVERMIGVLERYPHLAQMALKRQAWNHTEVAAGGVVEAQADAFTERSDDVGDVWTEQRLFFTTNPSVYSSALCRRGWPQIAHSEGIFTHELLADGLSFAYWGGKLDPPKVTHIGAGRAGKGY